VVALIALFALRGRGGERDGAPAAVGVAATEPGNNPVVAAEGTVTAETSPQPTAPPTDAPTAEPTDAPTTAAAVEPTVAATPTEVPSETPAADPTM